MKGIILAGGRATRLFPITNGISKQLLPVYNKPMIYYPLSTLMLAGIRDILIISTPDALPSFKGLFGDGTDIGLKISYEAQDKPKGIADSFIIGERFLGEENVCLILGDNLFYGPNLKDLLRDTSNQNRGATVFGYHVNDPKRYGVVEYDENYKVLSIIEKPKEPKSNYAVTGLYFYDKYVVKIAKNLKPSARGELEITDVNNEYLKQGGLRIKILGQGHAWLDTGTYDSLLQASNFIEAIEKRQGLMVGCIEEIAYDLGYIDAKQLGKLADKIPTSYGEYLKDKIKRK